MSHTVKRGVVTVRWLWCSTNALDLPITEARTQTVEGKAPAQGDARSGHRGLLSAALAHPQQERHQASDAEEGSGERHLHSHNQEVDVELLFMPKL